MAEQNGGIPPANLNGISRPGRGGVVVKPKNMKGTLVRLWNLTRGSRRGLGWILILSALGSAAAILSPYMTGRAVDTIAGGDALLAVLLGLCGLYIGDWLVKFLQQFHICILNLTGSTEYFRKIDRNDCNTTLLQQFFTGTYRLKTGWTDTDSTDTCMAQTIDHTTDTGELINILSQ